MANFSVLHFRTRTTPVGTRVKKFLDFFMNVAHHDVLPRALGKGTSLHGHEFQAHLFAVNLRQEAEQMPRNDVARGGADVEEA